MLQLLHIRILYIKKIDELCEVSIDISKFSVRRQKVAYQTVFAVNVGVIT